MIFSSMAPARRRRLFAGAALAVLAALGACGGGTSQYEAFIAQRLFVFGDDSSAMTADGRKYSINALNADSTAIDCASNPLWVQSLAAFYGFAFAECNPGNVAATQAFMRAAAGAKVADVAAQVDAQVRTGGFREKDLATVLAGTNDVLELYGQFPDRSEADLLAEARRRGEALAGVVNRLVNERAVVIVSTLPDMGLSPYALAQKALYTDTDRAALISRLTTAFNEQLGVKVLLDGRYVGLVQADLSSQAIARAPAFFGYANITTAACAATAPLPDCSTATLVTDGSATTYLWADATRLSPAWQNQLAQLAVDRARRNPF